MNQKKIRLNEAMTKDIECIIRVWECPGLHFKSTHIPNDAVVTTTFVIKCSNGCCNVGIKGTSKEYYGEFVLSLADFSNLEELQKNSPHLFEIEGELYAFS